MIFLTFYILLAYCYFWHLQIFVIFAFVSFLQFWCSRHFGMIVVFVILALSHFGSLAFLHFVISAFCYLDMSKFSYLVIRGRLTFCSLGILIFNNCDDYWFWHFVSRDIFACSTFRSYLFWVKHSWHMSSGAFWQHGSLHILESSMYLLRYDQWTRKSRSVALSFPEQTFFTA